MYSQLVTKSRNTPINSQQSQSEPQFKHESWTKTVGKAQSKVFTPLMAQDILNKLLSRAHRVLEDIIYHSAKYGTAFPTISRMALRLGICKKTVQRALEDLVERGLIYYINRVKNHKQTSSIYHVNTSFLKAVNDLGRASFIKGCWELLKRACVELPSSIRLMMSELARPVYKFFEECDKNSYAAPPWAVI